MRFKVKPDRFYEGYVTLYFKHGWWPFWRAAGWMNERKVDAQMEMIRRREGLL